MKKYFALFLMVATLVACNDVNQLEPIEEPDGPKTYTLTINAAKGENNATKALSIESGAKNVLNATWGENDEVSVYNYTKSSLLTGTLKAKTPGSANATLSGSLTGEIQENDVLYLIFPNTTASFTGQNGTLSKIAADYDYCYGKAKVTAVNGTNISAVDFATESAPVNFTNCQAIVKFTLLNKADNEPIAATSLTINAQKTIGPSTVNTLVKSLNLTASTPYPLTGDLTVSPAATNEVYVALCILSEYNNQSIGGSDITISATDGTDTYTCTQSSVSFTNGRYYEITLKMNKYDGLFDKVHNINTAGKAYVPKGKHWLIVGTGAEASNDIELGLTGESGATPTIVTLSNVKINGSIGLHDNDCRIILEGSNKVSGNSYEGIHNLSINTGNTLTIQGSGSLDVSSSSISNGAGIDLSWGCKLVINGGEIIATSGSGCGIGGTGTGDITINNGTITAQGSDGYAGIGGATDTNNNSGNIIITGGTVTATGGEGAAGIGSDYNEGDYTSNITISGGKVTATGGLNAAGIGSGQNSSCGDILIADDLPQFSATKGEDGPTTNCQCIGFGNGGFCSSVTIGDTLYWNGTVYVAAGGEEGLTQKTISWSVLGG